MLYFNEIKIETISLLSPYLSEYGNNSCQHSALLMLGLKDKYGDEYAISNNTLFIHRSKLDTDEFRFYLKPFTDSDKMSDSFAEILKDASDNGRKAAFETLDQKASDCLSNLYPDRFELTGNRDYSEYIYKFETLSILSGRSLAPKRNRVRAFYSTYADHIKIENINASNLNDIRSFQKEWIEDRRTLGKDEMLERENEAIGFYLNHYKILNMRGIVVYVKGTVVGYAAGVPLSDECIDEVIEKGRKDITGIYQLLCNEFALICCKDFKYINREEDIGIEGLRRAKMSYCPDILMDKYSVKEK